MNKYKKWYDGIINKKYDSEFYERHHIVPKCLGGSDDADNIVKLPPEYHYVAHLCLVKMYPDNHKLIFAANMMSMKNDQQNRQTNKRYGWLKRKVAASMSIRMKGSTVVTNGKDVRYIPLGENYDTDEWKPGRPPRSKSHNKAISNARKKLYQERVVDYYKNPNLCSVCGGVIKYVTPYYNKKLSKNKRRTCSVKCGKVNMVETNRHRRKLRQTPQEEDQS